MKKNDVQLFGVALVVGIVLIYALKSKAHAQGAGTSGTILPGDYAAAIDELPPLITGGSNYKTWGGAPDVSGFVDPSTYGGVALPGAMYYT